MSDPVTVRDDRQAHRYRIEVDGAEAGFAAYRLQPGRVVFTHTVIDPAFEGHGLGGRLARTALDDVATRGEQVVPLCPFISAWIRRHPEYLDLVDEAHREAVRTGT
ncbi:MAG TPA: GNAT family N-acetyltransferase [Amnibacterium sp.]|jgi:predicted GNAT family acetyltransferase|nr:GNAT family N-acetyltransferase [Amnibacterium sp.]